MAEVGEGNFAELSAMCDVNKVIVDYCFADPQKQLLFSISSLCCYCLDGVLMRWPQCAAYWTNFIDTHCALLLDLLKLC